MMVGGAVSVSDDGTIKKSGLAGRIFDHIKMKRAAQLQALEASYDSQIAQVKSDTNTSAALRVSLAETIEEQKRTSRVGLLRSWAQEADSLGVPIVAYLQEHARVPLANVVATVGTSTSTGRTPNPNNPDTAIQGPSAAVELPVTGAAGAVELPIL